MFIVLYVHILCSKFVLLYVLFLQYENCIHTDGLHEDGNVLFNYIMDIEVNYK